jgi:hypothetical protein
MPCRWASLSIGALLGNLEGICLLGLLREINSTSEYFCETGGYSGFKSELGFNLTQTYVSGFLFLGSEDNRKLSIGAIWSLVEGTGFP